MKKVFLTLLALVAVLAMMGTSLQAQTKLAFGPKAGASLADFWGDDVTGTDMKIGFAGGGFLSISPNAQITIQPELLYVMKGSQVDVLGTTIKTKYDYVAMPILIKWMFPVQGNVHPNLFGGVEPALLMSAKVGNGTSVDVKDSVKSFDLGLVLGAGVDFVAGSGTVTFDVRYTLGFTNWDDTAAAAADAKNSAITAFLGYAIPIGQ